MSPVENLSPKVAASTDALDAVHVGGFNGKQLDKSVALDDFEEDR